MSTKDRILELREECDRKTIMLDKMLRQIIKLNKEIERLKHENKRNLLIRK